MEDMSDNFVADFEAGVQRHGDRIALKDPEVGAELTYGELDILSGRIASKLKVMGVGKGDAVPVVLPQSIDYAAAMIAAMKLGAVAVPLDVSSPEKRLRYIFQDCRAGAVIDADFMEDTAEYAPLSEEIPLCEEDAALILYTSGSTGEPKGVRHSHGTVCSVKRRMMIATGTGPDDIFGLGASFFFSAGTCHLVFALSCGITMVLLSRDVMCDPKELAELLAAQEVTTCFISPGILRYFQPKSSSLRLVITGGERLSGGYSDAFRIVNIYASTETLGPVLYYCPDRAYDNTPLGVAVAGESVYILDDDGAESEEGELCIAGSVADCYLNRPEESAEVFVPNPFREKDGHPIMLKTGDMVKRLKDGNILYLNRKDWLLKINGRRVEPGEIEAALRKIPGITEAVVTGYTDTENYISLAAYYVSGRSYKKEELQAALREVLPEYMIPRYFVPLERMPVNANGKLDRKALPKPVGLKRQTFKDSPIGSAESVLCRAFEKVLGLREGSVSRNDDFFLIGGDSIRALQVMMCADLEGLSARLIYQKKTACGIAEALEEQNAVDTEIYEDKARLMHLPLTAVQGFMLEDLVRNPASTMYNLTGIFRLNSTLDTHRLAKAVDMAIKSHPALCSVLDHDENGEIIQYICPGFPPKTEVKEVTDKKLGDFINAIPQPFEVFGAPLMRSRIFVCGEGIYLYLEALHVVSDAASVRVLLKDISRAYRGEELSGDYFYSYIRKEAEVRGSAAFEKEKEYFQKLLGDRDWCRLPVPDFDTRGFQCDSVCADEVVTIEEMERAERNTGCTRNVLSIAAAMLALKEYCSKDRISVDYIHSNRLEKRFMDTVGPLFTTLPIAVDLSLYPDNRELLRETARQVIESAANSMTGYTAQKDKFSEDALVVNYIYDLMNEDNLEGFEAEDLPIGEDKEDETGNHADLFIMEYDGCVNIHMNYLKNAYRQENIQHFLEVFVRQLRSLVINSPGNSGKG